MPFEGRIEAWKTAQTRTLMGAHPHLVAHPKPTLIQTITLTTSLHTRQRYAYTQMHTSAIHSGPTAFAYTTHTHSHSHSLTHSLTHTDKHSRGWADSTTAPWGRTRACACSTGSEGSCTRSPLQTKTRSRAQREVWVGGWVGCIGFACLWGCVGVGVVSLAPPGAKARVMLSSARPPTQHAHCYACV